MTGGRVDTEALKNLIEDSGVTYRQNRRSYIFTCPRCGKKDKLMMFKSDGRFICWVCAEISGFKGRPEMALFELLGLPFELIKDKIYGSSAAQTDTRAFSLSLRDFYDEDPPPPELVEHQRGLPWPLDFYPIDHPYSARGLEYVLSRGITMEVALHYGLRYCPVQKRVIFPVMVGEKLLGWQARYILATSWDDEEAGVTKTIPKILTTGKRDSVLMFQDNLVGSDHAIICEGPVDAIKCHLAGGNVATMGKVVSQQQIQIIKGSGVRKIYLGLDRDAGAETEKLARAFNDYLNCGTGEMYEIYRLLPADGYEDLGAMPPELVLECFRIAPRVSAGSLFLSLET
jgi:hypothetical protein